jgi:hypothetical protein
MVHVTRRPVTSAKGIEVTMAEAPTTIALPAATSKRYRRIVLMRCILAATAAALDQDYAQRVANSTTAPASNGHETMSPANMRQPRAFDITP